MRIGNIRPAAGATRPKKRRGKGASSGLGGTSGKGHKGKKARAGGKIPAWFEGGQMPIQRRLPKRGFTNIASIKYQIVKLGDLSAAPAGATVDRAWFEAQRIVRRPGPVKLLAGGTLEHAVTVRVDAASASARAAVEAAGGKVETAAAAVDHRTKKGKFKPRSERQASTAKA